MIFSKRKIGLRNIVLLLTLFAFLIRLFLFDTSYVFWDEAVYMTNAQHIATGSSPYTEFPNRPPVVSFMLSFVYDNELASRILMAFLNSLIVPLIYLLGKELNRRTGIIASLIVTVLPFHILTSRWIMTDALASLSLLATTYLFWIGLKKDKKSLLYLGSFVFGLSILIKFTNLLLFILLLPLLLYFWKNKIKHKLKTVIFSVLLFFIPLATFFIFSFASFGNIFFIFTKAVLHISYDEPITIGFALMSLLDFFGPIILIFFLAGTYILLKENSFLSKSLLFWSFITLLSYLLLLPKGVAKPPTIEWEVERFLLPALPFFVITSSYAIQRVFKKKLYILIVFILLFLFSIPQYNRAYAPSIQFENGLREVTKELALYSKDILPADAVVFCNQNCPSFAYYSQKEIKIVKIAKINNTDFNYIVTFEPVLEHEKLNYAILKQIKRKEWVGTLYKNEIS